MDKIIEKTNVTSDDNNEEWKEPENVIKNEPKSTPSENTRSKTIEGLKKQGGEFIESARAFFSGGNQAPMAVPDSTAHVDSQFSPNDRVVVQTVREKAITGTVRWVGPVKTAKETGGIVVPVVGIETVS